LLILVIRKMLRNKWLVLCLLIGCILSVAMVGSVPGYTDAVFQNMLTKDLESYQSTSNLFPGHYYVKAAISQGFKESDRINAFLMFEKEIPKRVEQLGVPYVTKNIKISLYNMNITPEIPRDIRTRTRSVKLEALVDIKDHIKILQGRMYSDETTDGLYEVIVTEAAMKRHDLLLDEVYVLSDNRVEGYIRNSGKQIPKIKVVGVFTMSDEKDPYWFQGIKNFESSMIMNIDQLRKDFIDTKSVMLTNCDWYYALDYHKIKLSELETL
jgi:putative ABC transport system permease protein